MMRMEWMAIVSLVFAVSARGGECDLSAVTIGTNVDLAEGVTTNLGGVSTAFNTADDEFLVVWFDSRIAGQNDVYAQLVSLAGELLDDNITVVTSTNSQTDTSVAYNTLANEYFIGWRNQGGPPGSGGFNHTVGRILSASGAPLSDPVDLSNGGLERSTVYNDIEDEYFIEARNFAGGGTGGIRGQRVSTSGIPLGPGISIATAGAPAPAGQVSFNSIDNQYLATWRDQSASDLKGRIVNANGSFATGPFQISPIFPTSGSAASVAFDESTGRYLVVWGDFSTGPVRGQFVAAAGGLDGPNFVAADVATNASPYVAFDGVHGVYLLGWRIGGSIFVRLLSELGTPIGDTVTVAAGTAYTNPRISASADGGAFLVAWADNRNNAEGHNDTFAQIIGLVNPCAGDLDDDGDVDWFDLALFFECVTGPDGGPVSFECERADFDLDDDVDFEDFGDLSLVFTGS